MENLLVFVCAAAADVVIDDVKNEPLPEINTCVHTAHYGYMAWHLISKLRSMRTPPIDGDVRKVRRPETESEREAFASNGTE